MNVADFAFPHGIQWTETQELGTSTGFLSVPPVTGKGPSRRLQSNQTGMTGIDFPPTDRPVFAARGTRWSLVERMGVQGHAVRDASFPMANEGYWGPDNQHSVLEVSDVTTGTELPASDNGLRDIWAGGFGQVILNGADTEVNSDFTHARDISCEDVKYFCKSLAGQGRSMHMQRITVANCWTVLCNIDPDGTHGQFGGHVDTMSVGGFIGRIFEFSGTAVLGPLIFTSLKAEGLDRIGDWTANANEGSLIFNAGNLNFRHRASQGTGVPANVMGGNNRAAQIFNGVDFLGTNVLSMMPEDVRLLDGSRFDSEASLSEDWAMRAYNASLGVYCGRNHDLKAAIYGETPIHNVSTGEYRYPHVTIPYWIERCEFADDSHEIRVRRPKFVRQKSEFTVTVDGLDVTLVWQHSIDRVQAQEVGFCAGGAMRCDTTGQILWIKSVDGSTIQAKAMNGHDHTTATISSDGAWEFIGGGYKSPVKPLWGTFDGTDTVTLSGQPVGLSEGDMIAVSQYRHDFGEAPFIKEIGEDTEGVWKITLEKAAGFSGEAPLFVWIEKDIDMGIGLDTGMGVGGNTGGSSGVEIVDDFSANVDGWSEYVGTPDASCFVDQQSDDSASHSAGSYTGVLRYAFNKDFRIQKSYTGLARNTATTLVMPISFLANGDRVFISVVDGGNGSITLSGSATTPFTSAQTLTYTFTTPDTANGETVKVRLNPHSAVGNPSTLFVDSVTITQE